MDRDQVRHIAHLSRLELTPAEEEAFTKQLGDIFQHFQALNQLNTILETVPPTTRAIDTVNVTRPDIPTPTPDVETLLNIAPDREGEFFRVPQILG